MTEIRKGVLYSWYASTQAHGTTLSESHLAMPPDTGNGSAPTPAMITRCRTKQTNRTDYCRAGVAMTIPESVEIISARNENKTDSMNNSIAELTSKCMKD
jgi:hypothetical protein